MVHLIPGDLFYYTLIGMIQQDAQMFQENGLNCLLALFGMSLGFVLNSTIAHYMRKMAHAIL